MTLPKLWPSAPPPSSKYFTNIMQPDGTCSYIQRADTHMCQCRESEICTDRFFSRFAESKCRNRGNRYFSLLGAPNKTVVSDRTAVRLSIVACDSKSFSCSTSNSQFPHQFEFDEHCLQNLEVMGLRDVLLFGRLGSFARLAGSGRLDLITFCFCSFVFFDRRRGRSRFSFAVEITAVALHIFCALDSTSKCLPILSDGN